MTTKKNILVVLDSLNQNNLKFDFVKDLTSNNNIKTYIILLKNNPKRDLSILNNYLFSLIHAFEMKRNIKHQKKFTYFSQKKSFQDLISINDNLKLIEELQYLEISKKTDMIINFTKFDLPSEFDQNVTYSVFPHLDFVSNNVGIFKSVLNKSDSAKISILKKNLHSSEFLSMKIQLPVHRVVTVANLLCEVRILNLLTRIATSESSFTSKFVPDPASVDSKKITFLDLIRYVIDKLFHRLQKNIISKPDFSIYYLNSNNNEVDFLKKSKLNGNKNSFFADPFLYKHNNKIFCFFEEFDKNLSKGHISVAEYQNSEFIYIGKVLDEKHHLSYPYIFSDKNEIYMVPESSESNQINLYKAVKFPLIWKLEKVLIKNISAVDINIFNKKNYWWLFANVDLSRPKYPNFKDHSQELNIYSSPELISDSWTPHPENPLVINSEKARGAGFLKEKNNLIRISQKKGFGNQYGKGISFNKIIKLSESKYSEENIEHMNFLNFPNDFYIHHIDKEEELVVFDGRSIKN